MALDTYANLKISVANWLNRDDLTAQVPDFIAMAEAQVSRRLVKDGPVLDMLAKETISVDDEFVDVPSSFMGVVSIKLDGSTVPLKFVSPEALDDFKTNNPSRSGSPSHFALVGREYQFWPWSGVTIAGQQKYWQRIPALSDGAPTNWLLNLHPDAYLYGALLQAAPYLDDDGRTETWAALFTNVLTDICAADKVTSRAPRMDGPRPQIPA